MLGDNQMQKRSGKAYEIMSRVLDDTVTKNVWGPSLAAVKTTSLKDIIRFVESRDIILSEKDQVLALLKKGGNKVWPNP
jgi:hypothetical protein